MALSKRIARSCIHLGVVQLIFGCAGVACGAVAKSKLTGPVGATIGLWAAYFIALGVICLTAGVFKESRVLGFALVFQVIGLFIAAAGIIISAIFWTFLNTCSSSLVVGPVLPDHCPCGVAADLTDYDISCSDLRTVRNVTAASTFIYLILEITSFIGVIYACVGICCAPKEPRSVTVTTVNSHGASNPESKPMIMTKIFRKKHQPQDDKKKNRKR
ncbi:uncharacterized protein LOC114539379 [Dendronephthya gigantea]|nr:uncharacterized protein LOC114534171 isoform X2 [Dendronephthya gigantea]XP_028415806.1 uncharacterized protein LOC114539379 [Dendronephthya gigantea]